MDSPSSPAEDHADPGPGRGSTPTTPGWVKAVGIVALALVILVIVLIVAGGGSHGPGRHAGDEMWPAGVREDGTPSGSAAGGHTPPQGGHR